MHNETLKGFILLITNTTYNTTLFPWLLKAVHLYPIAHLSSLSGFFNTELLQMESFRNLIFLVSKVTLP